MHAGKIAAFALALGLVVAAGVDGQPPPGLKGGKGPPPGKGGLKGQPQGGSERLLDDLAVEGPMKAKARDILKAHDEKLREIAKRERRELLVQMKDVLDADSFKRFEEELERVPLIATAPTGPRAVPADDLIAHAMKFDANTDGKLDRTELPERMHTLFERGDTNNDGVLDMEELKRMSERSERPPGQGPRGPNPNPPLPPPPRRPGN